MRFDEVTAVQAADTPAGDQWTASIHPGWDVFGNTNGGYLIGIAARAMLERAGRSEVATITAHYLRPGRPGPVTVKTEIIRTGRRFTTVSADLIDDNDQTILRLLGAFTDAPTDSDSADEMTFMGRDAVELPAPEDCVSMSDSDFAPALMSRIVALAHPDDADFIGSPSGTPLIRGWFGLPNDEPIDSLGLLLAADSFPPAIFNSGRAPGWTPTVELTVHVRQRPVPGLLRCEFSTRFVSGGYLEEDALIWDLNGDLVAQSRQLALLPRAGQ